MELELEKEEDDGDDDDNVERKRGGEREENRHEYSGEVRRSKVPLRAFERATDFATLLNFVNRRNRCRFFGRIEPSCALRVSHVSSRFTLSFFAFAFAFDSSTSSDTLGLFHLSDYFSLVFSFSRHVDGITLRTSI